jgi:hypothetical protein
MITIDDITLPEIASTIAKNARQHTPHAKAK